MAPQSDRRMALATDAAVAMGMVNAATVG